MSTTDAAVTTGPPSAKPGPRGPKMGTPVGGGDISPLADEFLGVLAQCAQAGHRGCYERLLVEAEACLLLERDDAVPSSAEYRSAVLVALHAKLGSFKPGTSFIQWLRAIARHKARQFSKPDPRPAMRFSFQIRLFQDR